MEKESRLRLPFLRPSAKAAMKAATPLPRNYASLAGGSCTGFRSTARAIALRQRIAFFVKAQFDHPFANRIGALRTGFPIVRVLLRLRGAWSPTSE